MLHHSVNFEIMHGVDVFIVGICGSKLIVIKAMFHNLCKLSTCWRPHYVNNSRKSKVRVMNNKHKGTSTYMIRNFRRVGKKAYMYKCIVCVNFVSAFAYL